MTKRDRSILRMAKSVVRGARIGNEAEWTVSLVGEENRSPRIVRVHAMCEAVAAVKKALAQQLTEKEQLAGLIFGAGVQP